MKKYQQWLAMAVGLVVVAGWLVWARRMLFDPRKTDKLVTATEDAKPIEVYSLEAGELDSADATRIMVQYKLKEVFWVDRWGNVHLGEGITPNEASMVFWKALKETSPKGCGCP